MFQQDFLGFFWFLSRWQLQVGLKCRVFFVNTCSSFFKCQYPQRRRVPIQSVANQFACSGIIPRPTGLQPANAKRQWPTAFPGRFCWVKTWYIIAVVQLDLHPKHVRTTGFDPHL